MGKEISISAELLDDIIAAKLAKILSAKSPDEKIAEEMARQRGTDRPPLKEEEVECVSPITEARLTVQLQTSRAGVTRVTQILFYENPAGWDVRQIDGGRATDREVEKGPDGQPTKGAQWELYKRYWQRDATALLGKPLHHSWRADAPRAEPGSITLTVADLDRLGLTEEQIRAGLKAAAE